MDNRRRQSGDGDQEKGYEMKTVIKPKISIMSRLKSGGRLGKYKYFDMDQSIADAIQAAKDFLR